MAEENQKEKNDSLKFHFWFLVSFSLFLIVTFALYLPLRFEYKAFRDMGDPMMGDEHDDGAIGHDRNVYHEEGSVREGVSVNFNIVPVPVLTGASTQLDFFVNQKPGNIPVQAQELQLEHTKLMHVIGVRSDMNEFFHIHPQPTENAGFLSTNYIFAKPGLYKVWSEIKKDDTVHSFGHPEFSVRGVGAVSEKQFSFARNVIAGNYQVSLKMEEPVAKGHEHDLSFDIHTLTGQEVGVEDYLGAAMHLTIIKEDWKQFIHTHPEGVDETINFHVVFPEAGLYKMFAQFRPQGADLPADKAVTVSFWVKVEEKAPIGVSSRWFLFIISAVFILILSWVVARYLKVKPRGQSL